MKQVSQALLNYLHNRKEFFMCDLYELTLYSGLTFRYASYDRSIALPDGRTFSHKGPVLKRGKTKLAAGMSVDNLSVTVSVDAADTIGGVPMMHVAHNGGFDEAKLSLLRCFMDVPGVVVGAVEMFTGDIDVEEGGGLSMAWSVKSPVNKLNVNYPLRNYYPGCPYSIYDAGCGLSLASFQIGGAVTQADNQQTFLTNLRFAQSYYDQGGIEFLTGALTGVAAPIRVSDGTTGRMTLLIPLSAAPSVGDTFRVFPGCNKIPETCLNKFNNWSRNRATPYIPLPEAIM